MTSEQIIAAINEMELSEKLLLVEDIWNAIASSNAQIPMPEWQKQELDKRYNEFKQGEVRLHDWQSVHESLRRTYE